MRKSLGRLVACGFALTAFSQDINKLPVQRVVLYKNGVGYFEHMGHVRDNQDVAVAFTSGQLNDVLKSLTVLDLNGGHIAGVGYDSSEPIERQIGDLRLGWGEKTALPDFLGALRGARVEIRNGATVVTGRILGVEKKERFATNGTTMQVENVALITESGEMRSIELAPSVSVRLVERELTGKVGRYLDLASSTREPDLRRMVIAAEGTGDRSLFVSYISEVPVWKTTYRIVLNSKSKPLLQGWAIVDNTVGEDWRNVQLSLVAGAPQSFIQNLSQPYYSHRPVVALPDAVNIAPQTFEATLTPGSGRLTGQVRDMTGGPIARAMVNALDASGNVVGRVYTNDTGHYDLAGLNEGVYRLQIDAPGFSQTVINGMAVTRDGTSRQDAMLQVGSVQNSVEVTSSAPAFSMQAGIAGRNLGSGTRLGTGGTVRGSGGGFGSGSGGGSYSVATARAQASAATLAQTLGDLFEYKVKQPITILKNRSALVPILQSSIAAEKVSVWNDRTGINRPQRALWLTNSSGLTLDGGSFSILEDETFAGEGVVEPIRPDERRLVSYAIDLAVTGSSKIGSEEQRITRVRVNKGLLIHETEIREKKTYTFRNEDTSSRMMLIEHPIRQGYELRGDAKPSETTEGWMRFRLPVASKQTAALTVEEARPIQSSYQLTNLTPEQVALFVQQKSIDKTVEDGLRRILAQKEVVIELARQQMARDSEQKTIFEDQQRLRENMKALKGSPDEKALVQRYTQELDHQESRLAEIQKELEQIESRRVKEQAKLDQMIQDMSFDVAL